MSHTPAPWTVAMSGKWLPVRGANGHCVCDCGFGADFPENEENARLIAAAPDLLSALKVMLNIDDMTKDEFASAIQQAHNAIKKAHGIT